MKYDDQEQILDGEKEHTTNCVIVKTTTKTTNRLTNKQTKIKKKRKLLDQIDMVQ